MPERERGTVEGSVVALVVNYKTLELTRQCVQTLLAHYPFLPVVMIDNASADRSTSFIAELASERDNIHAQINEKNMHHGPALDQGMRIAEARYVLTLDSDCEILRAGFIEEMLKQFENPRMYAVGELRYKNRFGYTYGYWYADPRPKWIPYVHPYAMLIDRVKYLALPPFIHHGAPCIKNMRAAHAARYAVKHFPVYDFVRHHAGGTSMAHGYGFRGSLRLKAGFYVSKLYDRLVGERAVDVRYPRHAGQAGSERSGDATP
jgi:glycosyltransferase involved in cell wall biosynthesis